MSQPSAEQLFYRALELQQGNALKEAEALYREALMLAPDRPSIIANLAVVLTGQARYPEAESLCLRLLELDAADDEILTTLGVCQSSTGRKAEALLSFERALRVNPQNIEARNGHGNVLVDLKRPDEALASYNAALHLNPGHVDTLNNRGNALLSANRTAEALASYTGAYRIKPDYVRARVNASVCHLALGDFAEGWTQYEHGWSDGKRGERLELGKPWWNGKPLQGRLLVWGEQGIGDQILFSSMLPTLATRAEKVVVATDPRLMPLLQRAFPEMTIVPRNEDLGLLPFDAHIAMGSLGQHLRRQWADFPPATAYLRADPARAAALRQRLDGTKLNCGISWASKNNPYAEHKSMRLTDLQAIFEVDGINPVNLQYGDTADERRSVETAAGVCITHFDDIDNYNDIDGLAALIDACDVIVTISNTTAHLAGALGKPTLLLLPWGAGRHWYWHEGRDDSPWYPRLHIMRQPADGDWPGVVARARDWLARKTG